MTDKDKLDRVYYGMYGTNGGNDGLIAKMDRVLIWIENFDKNHAKKCFYLIRINNTWTKIKRIALVAGLFITIPSAIYGIVEIFKKILGGMP